MNRPEDSHLGRSVAYADQYDASLLYPMARLPKRQEIGVPATLPFMGADLWTAYELSWLNARGKPLVALAQITVPCETPNIVESKSLKLYLNSFSNTRFVDSAEVLASLRADLSEAAWRGSDQSGSVGIKLLNAEQFAQQSVQELDGLSLDRLDIECDHFHPAPELLSAALEEQP
ncbi:MAG: NADPH-dependent 7-cyano-7-deazaguanine reductase QueF, partial [Hylemonella sp.]